MAALGFAGFGTRASAATNYYIDNRPSSNCSDGGTHSESQPWCSFGPANKIRTFTPGDKILLSRGASWNEELSLRGSGTASEPITLGAYGTGPEPKILRNQATSDICVLLMDASHWDVRDLEVGRASVGILFHYTQLFNNGITISNVYAHDNKGVWAGHSTEYPVNRHVLDPSASNLNINLSSGILFNLASYLNLTSSQYVLKGVSVNDVRGANNVDSVAFDAETNTLDKQDGHNAFQDVTLNGLFLSDDNGHAAPQYQRAGLGCSDALRLIGMTNVTVMNSVLYNEAGCHTPTGTAAVILGRVSKVTLVNNIIFGVPESSSPDETAIDFEWSEDQVSLYSNLFAQNAGAGVEILNIHPGDHTTVDFSGNTFAQNAHAHQPGAASVWEDNLGRGYGTPTGQIRNNLYYEDHGKFFAGKSIASIADVHQVQTMLAANYAAQQFSGSQGKNQWRYMYQSHDSAWTEMPGYSAELHNGAWQGDGGQFVSAFSLAPARCTGTCETGGVARVWVAPQSGIVSIRGRVARADGQSGAGISAAINLVSGRNVAQIWPIPGAKQLMSNANAVGSETDVDSVAVNAGDMIRFEVHANGNTSDESVSWTPSVGYVPGTRELAASGSGTRLVSSR